MIKSFLKGCLIVGGVGVGIVVVLFVALLLKNPKKNDPEYYQRRYNKLKEERDEKFQKIELARLKASEELEKELRRLDSLGLQQDPSTFTYITATDEDIERIVRNAQLKVEREKQQQQLIQKEKQKEKRAKQKQKLQFWKKKK